MEEDPSAYMQAEGEKKKKKKKNRPALRLDEGSGLLPLALRFTTQFTCLTSTKLQIETQQRRSGARRARVFQGLLRNLLAFLVQKYKY